ncbi:UreD urease accessory protein-domain-containing protein [Schizophyllum amplum]|uniref:UreD urease accessory protein-domain-containing protein n=1 Tax=Schizophyllum amplum TaxID=97359 RepID=A0A550CNP6_9AGAR|nr:UreD urease accessory protein-domain-containing protein [Auriculariopsis ampla]
MAKLEAGTGRICLSLLDSTAVFSELSATYPLKLLSPRTSPQNVSVVYVLSYGGGLVGGDRVSLSVAVQRDAVLVMLSQGSTKVFKARPGQRLAKVQTDAHSSVTVQAFTFTVSDRSCVFLLPDPVTCFRAASYNQIQTFRLARDASLVVLDWITSGRKTLGEDWLFARYYSVNEIFVEGRRVARDAMLLEETPEDPRVPARTLAQRLAPYSCYAMLLLFGPATREVVQDLQEQYAKIAVFKTAAPEDLLWSLSSIDGGNGAVVRVAGKETEAVKIWLKDALRKLETVVGPDVYQRTFV